MHVVVRTSPTDSDKMRFKCLKCGATGLSIYEVNHPCPKDGATVVEELLPKEDGELVKPDAA